MGRFLIFFTYIGTRYQGVQIQNVIRKGQTVPTVESALQAAFQHLRPENDVRIVLSSRTDKGVHALKNACHVDLVYPDHGKEYEPAVITSILNYHLRAKQEDVRVLQTRRVPNNFHSRFQAKGRKYVYRLGHTLKPGWDFGCSSTETSMDSQLFLSEMRKFASSRKGPYSSLPLGEMLSPLDTDRVMVYRNRLDISKLVSAAEMLSGIHNFLSFTTKRRYDADYLPHPMKMLTVGVKRGQPFGHHLQKLGWDISEHIEFWDIHVRSSSFLYRQVRRLVGAMVLVARDVITLDDLREILDNPSKDFSFSSLMGMHEKGLYLVDVQYNPKDLEYKEEGVSSSIPDSVDVHNASDEEQPYDENSDDKVSSDDGGQSLNHMEAFTFEDPRLSNHFQKENKHS